MSVRIYSPKFKLNLLMNKIKNPLLVWLLLYSISFFSQTTVTGELQKWHTVAITFNGPNTSENSTANPFLDYRLNVTFSSPNGKTFVVPGFYAADGNAAETSANSGNKWRVRLLPMKWVNGRIRPRLEQGQISP